MTVEQCCEFLDAFNSRQKEFVKEQAFLFNGLAQQIISGIGSLFDKKNKFITLNKLYPELFREDNSDIPYEQSELKNWTAFLFG